MLSLLALLSCGGPETGVSELQPELELVTEELDFDEVVTGTRSTANNFLVRNAGRGLLVFDSIELTAESAETYSLEPPSVMELEPDEELALPVVYAPVDTRQDLGWLEISSNDPDRPSATVSIIGYGVEPDIDLDPQTLWFGDVEAGQTVLMQAQITASGYGALKLYDISFGDESLAAAFTIKLPSDLEGLSEESPKKLEPGESAYFDVEFAPTDGQEWEGEILIRSNDPDDGVAPLQLLGNTQYTGKEPPTVEILTPDWGSYYMYGDAVVLEGYVFDDADPPEALGIAWYAIGDDGSSVYLGGSTPDSSGYTTLTTDKLPIGESTEILLRAFDLLANVGEDRVDVTVWDEEKPVLYTLSGGNTIFDYWAVDDDVTIYLDNEPIFSDTDHTQTNHPPVEFEAMKGQQLRIVVNDVNACDVSVGPLYLHWGTAVSQTLIDTELCASSCETHACYDGTYHGPWPSVFYDETLEIAIP